MKKFLITLLVVFSSLFASAAVFGQSSEWIGTEWMSRGNVIDADNLRSNIQYIHDRKVIKPENCPSPENRLTWNDSGDEANGDRYGWVCQPVNETVQVSNDCTFNGQAVRHGRSVVAYNESNVAFGQSCQDQVRTCNDGVLSGTYEFNSCSTGDAQACVFDGQSVAHGGSTTAYQASSVTQPDVCISQQRSCQNGTLSGSYEESACSVVAGDRQIVAGCYVDSGEWDEPSSNSSCAGIGFCTETNSVSWSVGDFQQIETQGLGHHEFQDPNDYTISWTGDCTGNRSSCVVFGLPNGEHVARVSIVKNSTGATVYQRSIRAIKETSGSCTDPQPLN